MKPEGKIKADNATACEVVDEESNDNNYEEEKKLDQPDIRSSFSSRHRQQQHFNMTPQKSPIPRRSSIDTTTTRTKSWTAQRAPEPFSSPTPRPRRQKYGYGDLYKSTSSGSNIVEDRIGYRHSNHSSNKPKILGPGRSAYDRRRSTDANGVQNDMKQREKQPSFSALDFPVLSPVKSKAANAKEDHRSSSWSSVVGVQEEAKDVHNFIPPLPFADDVATETIDEIKPLDARASHNNLFNEADASREYWKDRHQPRQRSQSVHSNFIFSQAKEVDKVVPSPSSSFSTLSIAALQNDIGTLLARTNRVDEAMERYKLSIESATDALKVLKNTNTINDGGDNGMIDNSDGKMKQQCLVKVSEGLAWFRTKLLRGDVAPATADTVTPNDNQNDHVAPFPIPFQPAGFGGYAPSSPRRIRSASFCAFDLRPANIQTHDEHPPTPLLPTHPSFRRTLTPHITPKPTMPTPVDDIVQDIHQHQKLDCPEDVYSCNGRTPLGLEYICDPLPILGRSLRKLVLGMKDDGEARMMIETAALAAATLNLASLQYRLAGGGVNEKLQQVLDTLQQSSFVQDEECDLHRNNFFVLLKTVVHVNIGTCLYRLNKVRDATKNFERAQTVLDGYKDVYEIDPDENHQSHDDDRFPPREYLLLVTRINLSRAILRMNKHEDAQKLCDEIADDNKPHRRNSSSRRLSAALPSRSYGFRRSNSFAVTSSVLESATAAYNHDVDRRSKWLASVAEHFLIGLIYEAKGEPSDQKKAWHHYNRLLSLARTKLDHRHPYICSLLERRGAVLFSQRKLQCSMLSYLACLHVLEHQQSNGSNVFNQADLARVLYSIARVLHDKEEYHDALGMYHRALQCQREVSANSSRPSLDIVTTLCNISRVYHLSGDLDAALSANKEVLELATLLVGGRMDHPFLIHRLKIEGNILVEAGRLEDAMRTFVDAARRCCEDGRNRMMTTMMGGGGQDSNSQEDADAGDSSVLSVRSAATLAQTQCCHPGAAAA